MFGSLLESLLVILLWVGVWGIMEMLIDLVSMNDKWLRLISYIILVIFAGTLLWILVY